MHRLFDAEVKLYDKQLDTNEKKQEKNLVYQCKRDANLGFDWRTTSVEGSKHTKRAQNGTYSLNDNTLALFPTCMPFSNQSLAVKKDLMLKVVVINDEQPKVEIIPDGEDDVFLEPPLLLLQCESTRLAQAPDLQAAVVILSLRRAGHRLGLIIIIELELPETLLPFEAMQIDVIRRWRSGHQEEEVELTFNELLSTKISTRQSPKDVRLTKQDSDYVRVAYH
ncbi:hypothetical protein RSAG8_10679, partial [Rhizoctonia solani AG-8 WAC10335]